ncbi:MAG: sensor histidine kinase [Verrucomicrobiales bacterium]
MLTRPSLRTTISVSLLGFGALIIALNLAMMDRLRGGVAEAWTGGQDVWAEAYRNAVRFSLFEAGVVVLGSFALWWGWDRCITRRAEKVMTVAERLHPGGPPEAPLGGRDEISRISQALHAAHVRLNDQAAGLRAREERYRLMVETMPSMVFTCRDGVIEYANPAAISRLGDGRSETVVGRPAVDLVEPTAHADVRANIERLSQGPGIIRDLKRRLIGLDGQIVHAELTITGFQDEHGRAIQVIANDVTARLEAEVKREELTRALAEKNQELENLLYVASHDLRSPLVNIQGFARLLEREWKFLGEALLNCPDAAARQAFATTEPRIPRALEYISAGVKRIDLLLEGLLRVSRLGRSALDIQPLDPSPILADVLEPLRFQIEEAEANVETKPLPPCLADRLMLSQAFANLLDNALKYRDPSRPCHIRISGRREHDRVLYDIEDNGAGIAAADQAQAFEIFRRLHPQSAPGQGLGLTLVQRCLARMDGKIILRSSEGVGSVFTIDLPATT